MDWTALDEFGCLVHVRESTQVDFGFGLVFAALQPVYVPVVASDPESGRALLLYRGHEDDSVRVIDSTGAQAVLAAKTKGKWPLAVCNTGPDRFLAAWLNDAAGPPVSVTLLEIGLAPLTLGTPEIRPMPAGQILLGRPDGTLRIDVGDDGYDVKRVTRGGVEILLIYWQKVGVRYVGVDGTPDAPNRVLLADVDGWYVVTDHPQSALFPPRLSLQGDVAAFPGLFVRYADIRTRPLRFAPPLPPELDPAPSPGPTAPPGPPADVRLDPPPPMPTPEPEPAPAPKPKYPRWLQRLIDFIRELRGA